jgi:uncharacterized damage-inducible protein DinB
MTTKYRTGAKGALLDEYERAIKDLQKVISQISGEELTRIVDHHTADENCRSIQTILSHVVHSGYGYATYIHNRNGDNKQRPDKVFHKGVSEYMQDLTSMFSFTEHVFENVSENEMEQADASRKIKTPWNQLYDIEQLMEHAIVHILRHRRQIEKFKIMLSELKTP